MSKDQLVKFRTLQNYTTIKSSQAKQFSKYMDDLSIMVDKAA